MIKTQVYMSGDVARALGVSRERVRQLVALGRLRALALTVRGVHLFDGADVDRLLAERTRRQERTTST